MPIWQVFLIALAVVVVVGLGAGSFFVGIIRSGNKVNSLEANKGVEE